ncbi:MAG TPA: divalent metal cation transporter, partial [Flavihumibacter sp.]|nr:divalent metal cation transporter [Flavihumibacter sp.]
IVLAQTVTIFIVPFISTAIYLLANSESVMGADRNSMFYRIAGALGLAILFFLAIVGFKDIFIK